MKKMFRLLSACTVLMTPLSMSLSTHVLDIPTIVYASSSETLESVTKNLNELKQEVAKTFMDQSTTDLTEVDSEKYMKAYLSALDAYFEAHQDKPIFANAALKADVADILNSLESEFNGYPANQVFEQLADLGVKYLVLTANEKGTNLGVSDAANQASDSNAKSSTEENTESNEDSTSKSEEDTTSESEEESASDETQQSEKEDDNSTSNSEANVTPTSPSDTTTTQSASESGLPSLGELVKAPWFWGLIVVLFGTGGYLMSKRNKK